VGAQRVVLARPDRVGQIFADLGRVDVERGDELEVAHVVGAEAHVHEAGHDLVIGRAAIERDSLNKGVGAVSDSGDGDFDAHGTRLSRGEWQTPQC
jgi:hypothetical protein